MFRRQRILKICREDDGEVHMIKKRRWRKGRQSSLIDIYERNRGPGVVDLVNALIHSLKLIVYVVCVPKAWDSLGIGGL